MSATLHCWQCGADLDSILLPISRRDVCPACRSDLHVCKLCRQMDMASAKSCREPTVEEVRDKERSNFCDLFVPDPLACQRDPGRAGRQAQQDLKALFGLQGEAAAQGCKPDAQALLDQRRNESDEARKGLEDLFGIAKK